MFDQVMASIMVAGFILLGFGIYRGTKFRYSVKRLTDLREDGSGSTQLEIEAPSLAEVVRIINALKLSENNVEIRTTLPPSFIPKNSTDSVT